MKLSIAFLGLSALVVGCGGEPLSKITEAEAYAPAANQSCYRTQSPTGCGPEFACSGTIDDCASGGCWIVGSGLYLYPDGSWRNPAPGNGSWSMSGDSPRQLMVGGQSAGTVAENGASFDFACPAAP